MQSEDSQRGLKIMGQRFVEIFLIFLLTNWAVFAQETKPIASTAKANPGTIVSSKTNAGDLRALRKQQLRLLQEHVLTRALDNLRKMDEAALRLSARNQILTYLTKDGNRSEENKAVATKVVLDALADLGEHGQEIPISMAHYLVGDLGAWIQKHEPRLRERFQMLENKSSAKGSDGVSALLGLKDGEVVAARRIRQLLEAGREVDSLIFYLHELMKRNSKEVEPLLTEIVAIAERGASPSLQTLFLISQIYLSSHVPNILKRRFLSLVIARTHPANLVEDGARQLAYDLLATALPLIRELTPELYNPALTQSFALRTFLTKGQLDAEARMKRVDESLNPVEVLLEEAEMAKSKADRNGLLAGAAQLALKEKKLLLCLDIVAKLELEMAASPDFWRGWTDQFLKEFVETALAAKDTQLAEKGASRIASPLTKVEGLVMIMQYSDKANDQTTARRLLTEASRIAGSDFDNAEKARAFFLLSITCDQADESQKGGLLESGIRSLNSLSKPEFIGNDKKPYDQYVRNLDIAGYQLTNSFKGLTKQDENGALGLVERVRKADLRTFGMIGILRGLDDLLKTSRELE